MAMPPAVETSETASNSNPCVTMNEAAKSSRPKPVGQRPKDLTGQKFGMMTVLREAERTPDNQRRCDCQCDCGTLKTVRAGDLRSGDTTSCGCNQGKLIGASRTTHGMSRTPEYRIWNAMLQRCSNPKQTTFERYGAKGVKVCERWTSFENFIEDMGRRPSKRHQIDRFPDNDGDYEPGNCRWATPSENSRNRRSNVLFEHDGKLIHQIDMAKIVAKERGITPKSADSYLRLQRRLRKSA